MSRGLSLKRESELRSFGFFRQFYWWCVLRLITFIVHSEISELHAICEKPAIPTAFELKLAALTCHVFHRHLFSKPATHNADEREIGRE